MKDMPTWLPIIISILAFILSAVSLYLTQLRPGEVQITAGEHLNINHFTEGNVGLTVPVNVANPGSGLVTIDRFAMLVQSAGSTEGYLLEPFFYQKINDSGGFIHDSQPVPITIPAGGNVVKQVLFRSSFERPTEFQMTKAGVYSLTLLAWVGDSVKPRAADAFEIVVTEGNAVQLSKWLEEHVGFTLRFSQSQWRKWAAHSLTDLEVRALG